MTSITNGTSEAKIQAQLRAKLFGNRIKCPKCHRRYSSKLGGRYWCGKCRYKFSLKSCFVFKSSKLSFSTLWQLMECWLAKISISQAAFVCNLSETTTRRWYRKLSCLVPEEQTILSGVVEVDEAFIGKKKYLNQTVVVGGIERGSGKIALRAIKGRDQGETDRFILDTIPKDSFIHTDSWTGYWHLTEFYGYGHEMVNHSLGSFGPTNQIENVWMRLRRFIRKTVTRAWKEHLPRLLREFQARVNYPSAFINPINFLSFVPNQLG